MHLTLKWNNEVADLEVTDRTITIGGSQRDSIFLAGLPFGLVSLTVAGTEAHVTSTRSIRIGSALFPARIPRLLLGGETLKLPNDVEIARPVDAALQEKRRTVSTALVTKDLLSMDADVPPLETRAASLTCVAGADRGTEFIVAFGQTILGRAVEADFRLNDLSVSRRHARLKRFQDSLWIEELGKTNGLYVNGKRVTASRALVNGDVIELGQTMLRFEAGIREVKVAAKAPEAAPTILVDDAQLPTEDTRSAPGVHQRDDVSVMLRAALFAGLLLSLVGIGATLAAFF